MSPPADSSTDPNRGPVFAPGDYAGFFRRVIITIVDLAAVGATAWLLKGAGTLLNPDEPWAYDEELLYVWVAACLVYFVFIERSSTGTLGYLLAGVRIIDVNGKRPSWLRMSFRLLLWTSGPLGYLIELYWMTGDSRKQTLWDKLAGTLVVRKKAVPVGQGDLRLNRYTLMTYVMVFYEADPPRQESNSTPAAP